MQEHIRSHFARHDQIMHQLIQKLDAKGIEIEVTARPSTELFIDICEAIVGQQLSNKAANTIWGRFADLFPNKVVTPEFLLTLTHEQLRAVGLSGAKANYVRNLAVAQTTGAIDFFGLPKLSNDEIITSLTAIKGVGRWTAEMFLMFGLGRENVFSVGDLGLKKAIQKWYAKDISSPSDMKELLSIWDPFQTYAARILWKSLDTSQDS